MAIAHQSKYWRGVREYKVTKRQQLVLGVTKIDSINPAKPFILEKYNN